MQVPCILTPHQPCILLAKDALLAMLQLGLVMTCKLHEWWCNLRAAPHACLINWPSCGYRTVLMLLYCLLMPVLSSCLFDQIGSHMAMYCVCMQQPQVPRRVATPVQIQGVSTG
eukprot:scaffold27899_cov21-Tisochrysis_lutea.AAC.2